MLLLPDLALIRGAAAAKNVFLQGGPVMWPLLICSFLSVAITVERLLFWWRQRLNRRHETILDQFVQYTEQGQFDQALALEKQESFSALRVLTAALKHRKYSLAGTLEVAASDEIARMKQGLSVLDTIITMAPLLGILGTVTGIIRSFHILGAAEVQNPAAVISGIAEALIATAAGLIIALATLVPYNALVSKVQREARRLEQIIAEFEVALKKGMEHAPDHRI